MLCFRSELVARVWSSLVTEKIQNQAKNIDGRGSHTLKKVILLKEGKWGNEIPDLTQAGGEQKLWGRKGKKKPSR